MNRIEKDLRIPNGFILFLSGVPGVGKTTISYELLKRINSFRIIEETDIIREILRGYNQYLKYDLNIEKNIFKDINISDHTVLLDYDNAKKQCILMKKSIEHIILRQQRKGIATIINGVHVIPEILYDIISDNFVFINLYVTDENEIYNRIVNRNPSSYMLEHIPFIYKSNTELFSNTEKVISMCNYNNIFNINVTNLSVDDTIELCVRKIKKYLK
ncbi:MAG: AAA family ATPase [Lachnospiraceae bacterium]|nr:AAA family ATPase [Lachnospiraceae bacterium]